jgi:hypothetical protein
MKPTAAPLPLLLQAKLEPLRELCERYGVERLELFGSAAKGAFDPESSDIDLIAHFRNRRQGDYAARFLAFAEAAEALLQRPVDLLTEAMIKNPYFKQDVDESRTTLYVSP